MELNQVYEQAGEGIPEDWTITVLGRESEVISKGTTPTSIGKRFVERGVSFVKIEAITDDGRIDVSKLAYIDVQTHELLERSQLRKNDVLFSIAGALGRTVIVPEHILPANINQAVAFIRLKGDARINHAFLFHYLQGERIRRHIEAINVQGAQANLSLNNIRNFEVWLPQLPEQHAIAGALGDVDALISALTQFIAKKRDLKQAAMQQLLTGQTRLPGFSGKWEVKRIGEFTDCTAGGTPSTSISRYWGGNIRWMSSGELGLKIVHEVDSRITGEGLRSSSARIIPVDCVLIGLAGQGKTRGTVAINKVQLSTNQSIAAVLPSPAFIPEYLYYNLDMRYEELRGLSMGEGGRGGLNLRIIKSIVVPLPTIDEQRAIASVLSDIDAEIGALDRARDKINSIKQGMMQALLTGRVRLIHGEISA